MPAPPKSIPLSAIFSRRMLLMLMLGFSGGLPYSLTGTTLQAWLTDAKIDIKSLGLVTAVGIPYTAKILWSPLLDRVTLPFLGHRRGWLFVSQLLVIFGIVCIASAQPEQGLTFICVAAVAIAFFSATQDILTDAFRVETLHSEEFAFGLSVFTVGYRVALLVSGALAIGMADHVSWRTVYLSMAATMLVGLVATLIAQEPVTGKKPLRTFKETVVEPFMDYFSRRGWVETLFFIVLYKLDTNLTTALQTKFFLSVGFTKTDVATITKFFGMISMVAGGFVAAACMTRWTMQRALVVFGVLQAVASLSFLAVAHYGKSYGLLVMAIGSENFFSGMGIAAQGAFMMSLVNKRYSATQYALLTSMMALSGKIAGAPSGYLVEYFGWERYFVICALIGIPGLLMLIRFPKWRFPENAEPAPTPPSESLPQADTSP